MRNRMKERFVTLHPPGTSVDLNKDEGQIPYTLHKYYSTDSKLVTCRINNSEANLDTVQGLKVEHFPHIMSNAITGAIYILLNANKIDWLNIYFAGRQAYVWTKLYKLLNKKGKVYLKLDMDFRGCDLYDTNLYERKIFTKNTEVVDLVSVESEAVKKRIQTYSSKEIIVINDGVSDYDCIPTHNNKNRENTFLTVARLGTRQKATDILLEAFAKSTDQHDWNLKLVGTVDDTFKPYISNFFEKHPELVNRVNFAGEIKDRAKLYDEYCKAKVFVLASRWESYGISCAEALSCGCRLILSDAIPPAKEMTDNGKYGKIIKPDDVDLLSEAMIEATRTEYTHKDICERVDYAKKMFSWEKICEQLYDAMEQANGRKNGI